MNYSLWHEEYYASAEKIAGIIERLVTKRKTCSPSQKQELDKLISHYRMCRRECLETGNLLRERYC